jgi:hypothetical protein
MKPLTSALSAVTRFKTGEEYGMIARVNIERGDFSFILSKIISHLVTVAEIIDEENGSNGGHKEDRLGIAASAIQEAVNDLNTINQALDSENEPVPMDDSERSV